MLYKVALSMSLGAPPVVPRGNQPGCMALCTPEVPAPGSWRTTPRSIPSIVDTGHNYCLVNKVKKNAVIFTFRFMPILSEPF